MEIRSVERFLGYYERIRNRTRRVVNHIPPNQLEWTLRAGTFTLGDIVRHLAALERWMFAENVAGRPSRYPGHGPELADAYDAVLAYFERMHTESVAIIRGVGNAGLEGQITTPAGARMAAWKWLRAMVEHEVHHRGQLYLMLGVIDVDTPALYGLTSEEVRARSESMEDG